MSDLTEKEQEKLFAEISSNIRSQELDKLDDLVTTPDKEPVVEKQEEDLDKETPDTPDPDNDPDKETGDDNVPEGTDKDVPADKNDQPDKVEDDDKDTGKDKDEKDKLAEALALIESVKKENHALRSQAGRVPSLQRQLQQLDKKLEETRKLATSPSSRPSAKLNEKFAEKLADIKEADPVLAERLAELLELATDGVVDDLRNAELEALQAQRESTAKEYIENESQRLLDMVPNVAEVFGSPSWAEWKAKQSDRMNAFIKSDNADDVYFAIQKYAEDMVKQHPELGKKAETPEPAQKKDNDEAARIEAERRRKKESAAVVGSPAATGRSPKPDNEEALFKEISEQIRKEITGTA